MNFFRASVCLLLTFVTLFTSGCTYHGQIRKNIYKKPPFPEKKDVSVLVLLDQKSIPQTLTLSVMNTGTSARYQFNSSDGIAIAAADALGTLFARVDVGDKSLASQYDYVAEVDYSFEVDYVNFDYVLVSHRNWAWREKHYYPGIKTYVTLTIRRPDTRQAAIVLDATRRQDISFSPLANALSWLNGVTLSLLYPVLAPAYLESSGTSLRNLLEQDLLGCLSEIMNELSENRVIFSQNRSLDVLPRQDAQYKPLLDKTVYLEVPNGHGSGFFISKDGYILTNAHVVGKNRDIRFYLYQDYPFIPGRTEPPFRYARVIKVNKSRDLALLKTEGEYPYFELDTDRSHYKTGETVLVLGNPITQFWTVTQGIISATNNFNSVDEIQVDAAINGGNSGGPLVLKSSGKVIGINTRALKPELGSGMGYAVSAFEAARTLDIASFIDGKTHTQKPPKNDL